MAAAATDANTRIATAKTTNTNVALTTSMIVAALTTSMIVAALTTSMIVAALTTSMMIAALTTSMIGAATILITTSITDVTTTIVTTAIANMISAAMGASPSCAKAMTSIWRSRARSILCRRRRVFLATSGSL